MTTSRNEDRRYRGKAWMELQRILQLLQRSNNELMMEREWIVKIGFSMERIRPHLYTTSTCPGLGLSAGDLLWRQHRISVLSRASSLCSDHVEGCNPEVVETVYDNVELTSWEDFYSLFFRQLKPLDPIKEARDHLATLTQTHSVAAYNSLFRTISLMIPGLNEDEKYERRVRGFKTQVQGNPSPRSQDRWMCDFCPTVWFPRATLPDIHRANIFFRSGKCNYTFTWWHTPWRKRRVRPTEIRQLSLKRKSITSTVW